MPEDAFSHHVAQLVYLCLYVQSILMPQEKESICKLLPFIIYLYSSEV